MFASNGYYTIEHMKKFFNECANEFVAEGEEIIEGDRTNMAIYVIEPLEEDKIKEYFVKHEFYQLLDYWNSHCIITDIGIYYFIERNNYHQLQLMKFDEFKKAYDYNTIVSIEEINNLSFNESYKSILESFEKFNDTIFTTSIYKIITANKNELLNATVNYDDVHTPLIYGNVIDYDDCSMKYNLTFNPDSKYITYFNVNPIIVFLNHLYYYYSFINAYYDVVNDQLKGMILKIYNADIINISCDDLYEYFNKFYSMYGFNDKENIMSKQSFIRKLKEIFTNHINDNKLTISLNRFGCSFLIDQYYLSNYITMQQIINLFKN